MRNTRKIKSFLIENGISQTDISKMAGVCVQIVNQYINNRKNSVTVEKVLKGIGVPDDFMEVENV